MNGKYIEFNICRDKCPIKVIKMVWVGYQIIDFL